MPFRTLMRRIDSVVGAQLERLIISHHRRRLARLRHGRALEGTGGWAASGLAPRTGNRVDVLTDGAEALPAIAEAIESAQSSVWIAGWFFSPDFRLRDNPPVVLRDLLAETAERAEVRVLAWAGAPLPLFHPDRAQVRETRERLTAGTRIRMALDSRERPLHCHHEKLVIVDNRIAFVGGIDLTSYAGDRLDDRRHLRRGSIGWHDAAARLEGPVVADVASHFRLRWREVTAEELPAGVARAPAGKLEVQIARTVPERIYDGLPHGEFSILESYLRALRSAEHFVYLENQFLWSPEIVSVLAEKLREPADERFRAIVVLPAKPNNGEDDTRGQLGTLAAAAAGSPERFLACTLHQHGPGGRPVYVHAKIGIVDDRWLTLGSANLNEHSLFNDTEMNIVCHDPELAKSVRLRLWSEHLERPLDEIDGDPCTVVDEQWRPRAEEQLRRRQAGHPCTHRLHVLPGVSRRSEAVRGPVNGLFVDG